MATTKCSSCGGSIEIGGDDPTHIIAIADRFYHQGCIDVHVEKFSAATPAYHIPRDW